MTEEEINRAIRSMKVRTGHYLVMQMSSAGDDWIFISSHSDILDADRAAVRAAVDSGRRVQIRINYTEGR